MALVEKVLTSKSLGNGSTFVGSPRAGDFTSTNYKVVDDSHIPATGNLSFLNTRFNDVRYYVGDTPN